MADSTIRYTLTGSDPTESDPVAVSGQSITVNGTATLRLRAWIPGRLPSTVVSAVYTLRAATPVMIPPAGAYGTAQSVQLTAGAGATIRYTLDGTEPDSASSAYSAPLLLGPGQTTLRARAYVAGWEPSELTQGDYTTPLEPQRVAAPAIAPTGGEHVGAVSVIITTATPLAEIRWTNDGSEPTVGSSAYSAPIQISAGTAMTIRAKAFRSGWLDSDTSSATYTTFLGVVPTPTATPPSGTIDPGVVRLSNADPQAEIRYTLDGADPTPLSSPYQPWAPLALSVATTVKARAYRAGYRPSEVLVAHFQSSQSMTTLALNG
jgi:chitinase